MKIGDRVKLSEAGRLRYHNRLNNPHHTEGVLVEPPSWTSWPYRVQWDNEYPNSYKEGQLELVDPPVKKQTGLRGWFNTMEKEHES
jgi:hypothetical protein